MKPRLPSPPASWRRLLIIAPPYVWLILFLLVPFLLVLKISFADLQFGVPPYTALAEFSDQALSVVLNLRGYALLFTDSLYVSTYLHSVKMAAITTAFCILIGYPMAYYIARSEPATRNLRSEERRVGKEFKAAWAPEPRLQSNKHKQQQER